MKKVFNPYAKSLDGLILKNPVSGFFDFCKKREEIRIKREMGISPPWTNDEILQKGRFLNVFREDDRGSKAIIRFAKNFEDTLPNLVHALFFARWCNRQETLDLLSPEIIINPDHISKILKKLKIWKNNTAYPVESVHWDGELHSRFDAATKLFGEIKEPLTDCIISANKNVIEATKNVNFRLNMKNNFPIFMAVMDIAWFRPDVIDPASDVPTGIGAVAYLDILQDHLQLKNHQQTCKRMIDLQEKYWPEAKRNFHPIDIEYLSCECRKYYSYVNGTKLFEGKNIFHPKIKKSQKE